MTPLKTPIFVEGLDPKYIDPVPVTQKVIEGGDFGLSTQGGNDVHILASWGTVAWGTGKV